MFFSSIGRFYIYFIAKNPFYAVKNVCLCNEIRLVML